MKIVHSSDWHLGIELEGHRRDDEHQHFLDWLCTYLHQESVDVLLMAGDIFHQSNPAASALSMFYNFVQKLEDIPSLKRAVFIGGNHDSPTRLEAPKPLYQGKKFYLVGGYDRDDEDALLVPIEGADGRVEMVVVAAPYIHEARLGVSQVSYEVHELRQATINAFGALYTRLAERAVSQWPDATVVGMGHLTCGESKEDDYGTPLHNVGTIDTLPPSIFSPDLYRYVALGHIHRGYRVGEGPANYSGSPLSMRFTPSELSQRSVVEIDGTTGEYRRIPIPPLRQLKHLKGSLQELEDALKDLQRHAPVETWVSLTLRTDEWMLGAPEHFQQFNSDTLRVLQVHQERASRPDAETPDEAPLPDVRQMTPKEVFESLYDLKFKGETPSDGVRNKFDDAVRAAQGGDHE